MGQTQVSARRVATVVSVLAAVLFCGGLVIDIARDSAYRHFFITSDASMLVLFCVAAAYLRWGGTLAARWYGRLGGRIAQGFAILLLLGQSMVWVRVADRGSVWWALVFVVPALTATALAIVAVHLALRPPAADLPSPERATDPALREPPTDLAPRETAADE